MRTLSIIRSLALAILLSPVTLLAHCDTWDGPVVKAGQQALAAGDVNLALIWIQKGDEPEVRSAFQRALEVRRYGSEAQKLADQFFLETLVRVHRAGEGAPYTGLKPAGTDAGPAVPAGDKALETGDLKPVWKLLSDSAHQALHARFEEVQKARTYAKGDLEAGRRFVTAYVSYIHFVDGLFQAASGTGGEGEGHGTHTHED